jgi:uncharacterized OsmC-like protein
MKLTLLSEYALRLEPTTGPLTIESASDGQSYSPFHMLAGSLAYCTFSVFYAWAEQASLPIDDLVIDVSWTFADDPHRVDQLALTFHWPSLPTKRLDAAKRAAEQCTIHATLQHPPTITIDGTAEQAASSEHAQADGAEPEVAGWTPDDWRSE